MREEGHEDEEESWSMLVWSQETGVTTVVSSGQETEAYQSDFHSGISSFREYTRTLVILYWYL